MSTSEAPSVDRLVDDLIAGTACIEVARLGDVAIPMRALSEREHARITYAATCSARLALVDEPGSTASRDAAHDAEWPLLVATAALDPVQLRAGVRAPLFTLDEAGALAPADVDALLVAQRRAQLRAAPALDEEQTRAALNTMRSRPGRSIEALRARNVSAADFFGLPLEAVTDWQLIFLNEVTRT